MVLTKFVKLSISQSFHLQPGEKKSFNEFMFDLVNNFLSLKESTKIVSPTRLTGSKTHEVMRAIY